MPGFKVTHVYLCTEFTISHILFSTKQVKKKYFKEQLCFSSKTEQKMQRFFIYSLYIPHRDSLSCSQHPHQSGTFVTFINLQWCIVVVQSPWLLWGFTLGLCLIYFHIRQFLMLILTSPLKSIWDCVHMCKCFPLERILESRNYSIIAFMIARFTSK